MLWRVQLYLTCPQLSLIICKRSSNIARDYYRVWCKGDKGKVKAVSRAANNGQQVAGHDDRPNYFLARTNPDSGQSNDEYE